MIGYRYVQRGSLAMCGAACDEPPQSRAAGPVWGLAGLRRGTLGPSYPASSHELVREGFPLRHCLQRQQLPSPLLLGGDIVGRQGGSSPLDE